MKKIKMIVVLAALGLSLASCTKEDVKDDTYVVAATSSVTYFINGEQHYANPQTEAEWSLFLDRMFALAVEEHSVRFVRTDVGQQVCSAKEKLTYETDDFTKAKKWAMQKTLEGYDVTIVYDQATGIYTCTAVK